jgi:hypothetical protein
LTILSGPPSSLANIILESCIYILRDKGTSTVVVRRPDTREINGATLSLSSGPAACSHLLIFSHIYHVLLSLQKIQKHICTAGGYKRFRLSWLTNSYFVYMSTNAGGGGSCGVSANEYSCTHGAHKTLEIYLIFNL